METTNNNNPTLTAFAKSSGCGCKIAPAALQDILQSQQQLPTEKLLVGNHTNDDAAVYDLGNGTALIATTDFFTPIVNDAYTFGRIAAANAISDVYAMGGTPTLALAILGWPLEKLPASVANQVMEGARYTCKQAGIPLAGGHSIESAEPFFGLSVNGLVATQHITTNSNAQPGDVLYLTKPLGSGILAAALKRNQIHESQYETLISLTTALNHQGIWIAQQQGVHAMTDVTGFGLLGHIKEMATSNNLAVTLSYQQIPIAADVITLVNARIVPDAVYKNWGAYGSDVQMLSDVPTMEAFNILSDPQTNGGLLIAVAANDAATFEAAYVAQFQQSIFKIGAFTNAVVEQKIITVQS
ncbi:MAG TPA: selenide, water dikinase SelD [Chitinophagaceae bacterium]|nr:selenide, water dikinase SelD [Chitinophagaceae bacterium]HAN37952.1 selenide, water dikinase SelD [Chitinophagaceae bacterium]